MSHSTVPCAYSIYVNIHFYKFNCNSRFYYSQINVDKDDFILTTEVVVDNFILKNTQLTRTTTGIHCSLWKSCGKNAKMERFPL